MTLAYRAPAIDRRLGLLLTALVHVALVIGWQAVRTLPAPPSAEDSGRSRILWIPLPLPRPAVRNEESAPAGPDTVAPRPHVRPGPAPAVPQVIQVTPATPATPSADTATPAPAASAEAPAAAAPAASPSARQILERARRDIGGIDKALRKENNPYIGAPLDSPQMRLRRGMEQAAAMAKPGLFEAPKVEELVNNTGDGARRSRVITGDRTYCLTERASNTDVEMIEHHGKLRITNCPTHEEPSKQQAWRTLRD
jgi:pyruvate/2-oxoglutarate dehydrogenase complex dihydrolipoamide acyltransferase (E2) component